MKETANILDTISRRIRKLKKYDDAYYNSDTPLVPDNEYDEFRAKTLSMYRHSKLRNEEFDIYFEGVRAKVRESKRTAVLPITLGSLTKAKNDNNSMSNFVKKALKASKSLAEQIEDKETRKHFKKLVAFNISPKLDGLTFLLHYEKGELVAAYSGGDGVKGQLKSKHAQFLIKQKIIPKTISHENPRYIVGEIVCSKKKFADVVKQQKKDKVKNTYNEVRNAASGWLNSDSPPELLREVISFIAYDIKTPEGDLGVTRTISKLELGACKTAYKVNTIATLKKWGFKTYAGTPFHQVVTTNEYTDEFKSLLDSLLSKVGEFEYPLDGLVVEVADSHIRAAMGTGRNGTPKFAVAYKVSADSAIASGNGNKTHVIKIESSTSKVGALKPTLHYSPIKIDGATFSKATGNNYNYLLRNGIGVGTKILVVKAGDVIPKAYFADSKKAEKKYIFPQYCSCGANAIEVEDKKGTLPDLYCELGTKCPEAKYEQLAYALRATKLTGLGAKNIRKLYDFGLTDIIKLIKAAKDKKKSQQLMDIDGFGKSMLATLSVGLPNALSKMKLHDLILLSNVFVRPGLSLAVASLQTASPLIKKSMKEGKISKSACKEILGEEKGKLLYEKFGEWQEFKKRLDEVLGD